MMEVCGEMRLRPDKAIADILRPSIGSLVGGLARDPQVESLLAGRRKDLGLTRGGLPGAGIRQQLMKVFTLGRGIDR